MNRSRVSCCSSFIASRGREIEMVEIKPYNPTIQPESPPSKPNPSSDQDAETKSNPPNPAVEIHVYRQGKGPIEVFKSKLGGYEQDQLEVQDVLDRFGFKSIFAFNPGSGRGVSIRFNPRNGRSLLPYRSGAVVYVDGEPRDSLIKPISKILFGVAVVTLLITLLVRETPAWFKRFDLTGGTFPPWVLACMVIVFIRLRKRTKDIFKKYGW